MKNSGLVLIALISLSSLAAPRAMAWGPLEHKAVALIAQDRLSPQARRAVQALIGAGFGLDKIANCADGMLFASGTYDCGGAFTLAADPSRVTQPWHYIDIPATGTVSAATVMTYCPSGRDCVVEQIRRQAALLEDAHASIPQRQLALMLLVHLVGDEHQPLHCADDADFGGNKKPAVLDGRQKNLHSLWDDMIMVEDWRQQSTMDPAPLVGELEADLGQRNVGSWATGDFVTEAAVESFEIARDTIYMQYAKDQGQNLGDAYRKAMQPIAKQRIEMAGVRLAAIIEEALGKSGSPTPAKSTVGTGSMGAILKGLDAAVKFD